MTDHDEIVASVERMKKDIREASIRLSVREARFLVDAYYQMQGDRRRAASRAYALRRSGEPNSVISWLKTQSQTIENQIKVALDRYSAAHPVGQWMRSVRGIGPVISAGYLANLDITRAPTAGHFWSVCGLVPGRDRRVPDQKITWNPSLKRLAWITGESFKKLSPDDPQNYYRIVYDKRKEYEIAKNERLEYAKTAAEMIARMKFREDTKAYIAYAVGKLPLGHIDRRSARYATKLFLAHLHEVWYRHHYKKDPPLPYPIAHMNHAHTLFESARNVPSKNG